MHYVTNNEFSRIHTIAYKIYFLTADAESIIIITDLNDFLTSVIRKPSAENTILRRFGQLLDYLCTKFVKSWKIPVENWLVYSNENCMLDFQILSEHLSL